MTSVTGHLVLFTLMDTEEERDPVYSSRPLLICQLHGGVDYRKLDNPEMYFSHFPKSHFSGRILTGQTFLEHQHLKSIIQTRFGQTPLPRQGKTFKIFQALNFRWKRACHCQWPIPLTHMCLWQWLNFSPDLINLSLVIWDFCSGCGDPCCVCSLAALPPHWTHSYWWEACPETFCAFGLKLREGAIFQSPVTVLNHTVRHIQS